MTFRVFGMTESKAWQLAKTLPPNNRETIEEYEARIHARAKKLIDGNKEVPLSGKFDAPPVCPRVYPVRVQGWPMPKPSHSPSGRSERGAERKTGNTNRMAGV